MLVGEKRNFPKEPLEASVRGGGDGILWKNVEETGFCGEKKKWREGDFMDKKLRRWGFMDKDGEQGGFYG